MVLTAVKVPALAIPPPLAKVAVELPVMVESVTDSAPLLKMPPPREAELSAMVVPVTVATPSLTIPPPMSIGAELPWIVLSASVNVPWL